LTRAHSPALCAILAALSIALSAPCMQPQPNAATTQSQPAPAAPSIDFTFEHPGVPVPRYTLTLSQNGQGQYRGEQLEPAAPSDPPPTPQPFDTAFAITPTTTAKIFALSAKLNHFHLPCASHAKNIASTGAKTLRYTAPDTTASSCTYDYTENKDVQQLTQILQAIAETMDQGRRLDFLHQYDRLGLDHAITALASEVSSGQALELTLIAPTLHSIAEDAEVMQRVRTRATALLFTIPATETTR
jgi:hypothetical protein